MTACLFILFSGNAAPGNNGISFAAESREIHPDMQMRLIEKYLSRQDVDRAVTEFERFAIFFPDDARIPAMLLKIGRFMIDTDRAEEAVNVLSRLVDSDQYSLGNDEQIAAYFMLSRAYHQSGEIGRARLTLQNLLKQTDDITVRDKANFFSGWLDFEAGKIPDAQNNFSRISRERQIKYRIASLQTDLLEINDLPQKSPRLSGALSVLPGMGYLYCERPRDAAMSLVINAAMIGSSREAFDHDLPILGTLIALVEIGFYGGNIYGGINAAHKYNRTKRLLFIDKLKKEYASSFSLSVFPDAAGKRLAFGLKGHF